MIPCSKLLQQFNLIMSTCEANKLKCWNFNKTECLNFWNQIQYSRWLQHPLAFSINYSLN